MTARFATIIAGAIACAGLWSATAAAAPATATLATPADHRAQATRLRQANPSRRVSVSIGVRHDGRGIVARVGGRRVNSAPLRAIVRRHGATTADIAAIVRWARSKGLTPTVGRLRTRVIVTGPAARMSRALDVPLHHYRTRAGRTYIAAPRVIPVPPDLTGVATGIAGLSHVPPPVRVNPSPAPAPQAPPVPASPATCANTPFADMRSAGLGTPMTPFGMAQAYGFDQIGAGASYPPQTIAILEVDQNYNPDDLAQMQQTCRFGAGSAPVDVRAVNLPGAQTQIGTGGNGEANLDAQLVATLAPAGTSVVVINVSGQSPTPFSDFLERAAALPNLTAISMSYGTSEMAQEMGASVSPQEFAQANSLGAALAASGVSLFASAGDQGSMGPPADQCTASFPLFGLPGYPSVNWPASAPGVTAVGGTMWNATARSRADEVVWNEVASVTGFGWPCPVAGGGGGQSAIFPRPAWQAPAGAAIAGSRRLVPDLAMLAGQPAYLTQNDGNAAPTEGTSASAPLLASAVLRINAERLAAARQPVGYLSPLLYGPLAGAISDVTVGSNDIFGTGLCCTAGPGYDMASGLGAPDIGRWPGLIP